MHIAYRPEVDGLRAVAILPVVLFHLGVAGFSGGFVGVDVFFVISGFLITSIIHDGLRKRDFSFRVFYIRRAKRILPVLLTVLAATYLVGLAFFWPIELTLLAQSTIATLLFVSNMFFWWQVGYFGPDAHSQPLLHTWSISVEEQYYIIFPLMLVLLARLGRSMIQAAVVTLLVAGFVASSFAIHAWPNAAFYLFPFRFWELMVGSALAVLPLPRPGKTLGSVGFLCGLVMICVAVATFDEASTVPGLGGLLPCIGAALVIWSGPAVRSSVGLLLANPVTVGVGKISYSMYLWHWPMIVYLPLLGLGHDTLTPPQIGGYLVALLALSAGSYYLVENPFRRYPIFTTTRRSVLIGGTVAAMLALFAIGVATDGLPQRLTAAEAKIYETVGKYRSSGNRPECFMPNEADAASFSVEHCMKATAGKKSILLWGDSVAAYQSPGLRTVAESAGVTLMVATMGGCRPMVGATYASACDRFTARIREEIRKARPDLIVLSARWNVPDTDPGQTGIRVHERGAAFARSLRDEGFEVVMFGPPVQFTVSLPLALMAAGVRDVEHYDTSAIFYRPAYVIDEAMVEHSPSEPGIRYTSVIGKLCEDQRCPPIIQGVPLTWDEHHLTREGSDYLAARVMPELMHR